MSRDKEVRTTHPSFGVVRASRVSGHRPLFMSPVDTGGFVRISIAEATHVQDTIMGERAWGAAMPLIEIDLSESQWVSLISRMNMGEGTPCTLSRRPPPGTAPIAAEMPDIPSARQRFGHQIEFRAEARLEEIERDRAAMYEVIEKAKLPAKTRDLLLGKLGHLTQHLVANAKFGHTQLQEHADKVVTEMKVEINAMVQGVVTQLGVETLRERGGMPRMIGFDDPIDAEIEERSDDA